MLSVNEPETIAEVTAAFEAYEAALVTNDVAALQNFFWNSSLAVRFGVSEQLYGFDEISEFRRNRIINFSGRRGIRLAVTTLGPEIASVTYEYVSNFSGSERRGRQSQVWAKFDGEWKIVAAHVSLAQSPRDDGPDWTAFVRHTSGAQRLDIDPAYLPGVAGNMETLARLAAPLLAFELPPATEPAPVFSP